MSAELRKWFEGWMPNPEPTDGCAIIYAFRDAKVCAWPDPVRTITFILADDDPRVGETWVHQGHSATVVPGYVPDWLGRGPAFAVLHAGDVNPFMALRSALTRPPVEKTYELTGGIVRGEWPVFVSAESKEAALAKISAHLVEVDG